MTCKLGQCADLASFERFLTLSNDDFPSSVFYRINIVTSFFPCGYECNLGRPFASLKLATQVLTVYHHGCNAVPDLRGYYYINVVAQIFSAVSLNLHEISKQKYSHTMNIDCFSEYSIQFGKHISLH